MNYYLVKSKATQEVIGILEYVLWLSYECDGSDTLYQAITKAEFETYQEFGFKLLDIETSEVLYGNPDSKSYFDRMRLEPRPLR